MPEYLAVHRQLPSTQVPPFLQSEELTHVLLITSQRSPVVKKKNTYTQKNRNVSSDQHCTNTRISQWITETILTLVAVPADALELVFSTEHARTAVQTWPAVTRALIHTLTNSHALCEAVGQIHLLSVDRNLDTRIEGK